MFTRRIFWIALLLGSWVGVAAAADSAPIAVAVPGEVIVKYRAGLGSSARAATAALLPHVQLRREFDFIQAQQLRFDGISTDEAIARLRSDPNVAYAEPNYIITATVVPNDPRFPEQYALRNTGQGGGYAGDDIKATQAWDLFTGDPNLKVGVIDTGIDYTHPDLAANIWTNPGEIAANGRDDDHNGYVDDVHGYDCLNNDGDPMDDGTHGTHVAGSIAAVGNNGVGIAGVNWQCKLVAIKFMNASGIGSEADAIASIQYAIAVGVKLTNNSWGNMPGGQALFDAIAAAGAAGQLFITAAGNNRWNIDLVPVYPACFASPYILTVAATDERDLLATFSNYGVNSVHLGAPGARILSCQPGALYQVLSGTSMAAPHVAGVAALAYGRFPLATNLQIRQLILASTDPIPSLAGMVATGGRLNAFKVLTNGDGVPPSTVQDLLVADTGSTAVTLHWTAPGDDGPVGQATSYDVRLSTAPINAANFASATPLPAAAPLAGGSAEALEVSGLVFDTVYYFAVEAVDDFGNRGTLSNLATTRTLGVPILLATPAAVPVTLFPGGIADPIVSVANLGAGRLDFTVPPPSGGAWIAVSPPSGRVTAGNSTPVTIHLDATGLALGVYMGGVQLQSNDPAAPVVDIPVTLTIGTVSAADDAPPRDFGLRITSGNPGPGGATFALSLPRGGAVEAAIFDVRGARIQRLLDRTLPAGIHPIRWDATDDRGSRVGAGVYFVQARTPGGLFRQRVVILN